MRLILVLWIMLQSATAALAQDLRVITADFPTISQQTDDKKQIGLGVEIMAEMARRLGISYSIEFLPWRRCLAMMQSGEADILIGPYRTPDRAAFMDFSTTAIYTSVDAFFVKQGHAVNWRGDLATLGNQRITTVLGWYYGAAFEDSRAHLKIDTVTTLKAALQSLAHEKTDLVIATVDLTRAEIARMGLDGQIVQLEPTVTVQLGYLGYGRTPAVARLAEAMDRMLRQMHDDGTITAINAHNGRTYIP